MTHCRRRRASACAGSNSSRHCAGKAAPKPPPWKPSAGRAPRSTAGASDTGPTARPACARKAAGSANTDGDGAGNAHECRHGTDPTRTPAETILPDINADGANDRFVYGNVYERHTIPKRHVDLAPETRKFFKELSAWIDDEKYFIKNAKKVSLPKVIGLDFLRDSQNRSIARRIGGRVVCTLYANPNAISVTDAKDDPDEDNYDVFIKVRYSPTLKVTARDFSGFNQDAWLLATRMLRPLRADNAVLTSGTRQAEVISRTLGAYLDAPVLSNRLLGVGNGVLPQVADPEDYDGDSAKVLESMEFVRDKITLPDPQNQVTEEERNNSPNLDIFGDSDFPQRTHGTPT